MIGRTFEETFAYETLQLFKDSAIEVGINFDDAVDFDREYQRIYEHVTSSSFKKTAFALNVASSDSDWNVPAYISNGLIWLEEKLSPVLNDGEN